MGKASVIYRWWVFPLPCFIAGKGNSPSYTDVLLGRVSPCPPAQAALQSDGVTGASHEHIGTRGRIDPKVPMISNP